MNHMTEFLIKEQWSPRRFLEILNYLLKNGFVLRNYLSDENKKAFQQKIMWATQYAMELEPAEEKLGSLGKYIKSQFIDK